MQRPGRAVELLLVQDYPTDGRLTREALALGTVASHVSVAPGVVEAMQFLRQEPPQFASAPVTPKPLARKPSPRWN